MMRFEDVSKLCDCWLCGWSATRGLFKIGSNRCLRVLTLTAAVSSVKRTPSGHQADTKRTPSGHQADTKRTPSGHQADTKKHDFMNWCMSWLTNTEHDLDFLGSTFISSCMDKASSTVLWRAQHAEGWTRQRLAFGATGMQWLWQLES